MKGLLLKDAYLAWAHFKMYLVMVLAFSLLSAADPGNFFLVFYPCMLCGMIPVNLIAYDERSKWDIYSALLPFTRSQIVASKYIFGLIGQAIILSLVAVVNTLRMAIAGGMDWQYLIDLMGILVMFASVSIALPLPFIFKMGVEKGRMGYYMMIGLAGVGSGVAGGMLGDNVSAFSLPNLAVPIMILVGIAVYGFSWWLSVRFYEKREL
jgi:hypothetical protein